MILIVWLPLIMVTFCSCGEADSEKEWGSARIYMPQATYGDNKYIVPNDGTATQHNLNYAVSGDRFGGLFGKNKFGRCRAERIYSFTGRRIYVAGECFGNRRQSGKNILFICRSKFFEKQ